MLKTVLLNGQKVNYFLERKKVKNINLRIKPDQTLHVSAHTRVPVSVIEGFLQSKADYILKAVAFYAKAAQNAPALKKFETGEEFYILGQRYPLTVQKASANRVEFCPNGLLLAVKDPQNLSLKQKTFEAWQKNYCKTVLVEVCQKMYPRFQPYGIEFPEIRFRKMVSRWGSCQPQKKVLTFNTHLVEAPPACVEYVVAHEFTHFLHPNHSKEFYNSLASFMPDWAARKKLLNESTVILN